MKYNNLLKTGIGIFTLVICGINIIGLQKNNLKQQELIKNDAFYLKKEQKLASIAKLQKKIPSFGLDNLLADLTFLRYVQYFGDTEARDVTGYSVVTDYFENIVERDPNFVQSHLIMSSANSLFAAKPQKTVEFVDRALEEVSPTAPNYPFLLWSYKATDEILFLGDLKAAQNSYETAAEWAKEWAKLHNDDLGNEMAERYEKSAAFLATNPDSTQAQIGAWMNVLSSAKDKRTANYIISKLEDLGVRISMSADGEITVKPPKKDV